ncbi:MAG: choice-of-anchor Q domain-containing protein, partial [Vicinamibacteria bacterium]
MKAAFPVAFVLLAWIAPSVRAEGVVGTGTPESCTEGALATALTGGGIVTFDCGPAVAVIPFTTEHVLDSATTLDGGDLVQLDGQNTTRLFRVPDAAAPLTVTFRDITLQFGRCPSAGPGANAGGAVWAGANVRVEVLSGFLFGNRCGAAGAEIGGGAVYVRGGSVTLDQVDAASNGATDGGSIHAVDSTVLIDRSFFVAIPNGRRGGAVFANGGSVALRRSAILASAATGGGAGIYATGPGTVTVEDSLISGGNATGAAGGGVHQQGGTLSIQRATFDSNRADQGGAVHVTNVVLDVANTTFRANRALAGRGGAIRLASANAGVIAHSTFAENRASAGAGAVSSDASSASAAVQLRASILEDNATASPASPSCDGVLASGGFNFQSPGVAGDADCVAGIARVPVQLGPLALPNGGFLSVFPLLPTSPARDVVTSGCPPPATDELGITRPFGPACDSGAVEFAPVITIDDVVVTEGTGGTTPATFTIRLSQPSPDTVIVSSATMDGTAVAGEDYDSGGGPVVFLPGETQATVTVM